MAFWRVNRFTDPSSAIKTGLPSILDVDLDELLFSEQLAVRSAETEETIGSYAVKAEKGEDEDGKRLRNLRLLEK